MAAPFGAKKTLIAVIPLGTGAVTAQTKAVGVIPSAARVTRIRYYGQAAVTAATVFTVDTFARTPAGGAGVSLQSAVLDIEFASATLAKAGVAAALAAQANRLVGAFSLIEAVFAVGGGVSAGPGDVTVLVEYEDRTS